MKKPSLRVLVIGICLAFMLGWLTCVGPLMDFLSDADLPEFVRILLVLALFAVFSTAESATLWLLAAHYEIVPQLINKWRALAAIALSALFFGIVAVLEGHWLILPALAVFVIGEAVVLWPLAQHWRTRTGGLWLTMAALIPGGMGITSAVKGGIAGLILVPFVALAGGLCLGLLVAKAVDPQTRRSVRKSLLGWLQSALGERPNAYWMVILWIVLGVSLVPGVVGISPVFLYPDPYRRLSGVPSWVLRLAIPVALMATALHKRVTRPPSTRWVRSVIPIGLVGLLAIGLYFAQSQIILLPGIFGADVPESVSLQIEIAWSLVTPTVVLALCLRERGWLSALWKIITVGMIAGALLVIVLSYPVYTAAHTCYADFEYAGQAHERAAVAGGVSGLLLALAVGPVAARWSNVQGWQRRFGAGSVSGALAAVFVFGGLVCPVAGLIQWSSWSIMVFDVFLALNTFLSTVYSSLWLLIVVGVLVGGLTGLLTPVRSVEYRTQPAPVPWSPFVLVSVPLLAAATLLNLAVFSFIQPIIENVFDYYGFRPGWNPAWTPLIGVGFPWLALIAVQALALYRIHRPDMIPRRRSAAVVGIFSGLIAIISPCFLWAFDSESVSAISSPLLSTMMLVVAVLGVEMLVASWRCLKSGLGDDSSSALSDLGEWSASGALGGILSAVLGYLPVAIMFADFGFSTGPNEPPRFFEDSLAVWVGLIAILAALGTLRAMLATDGVVLVAAAAGLFLLPALPLEIAMILSAAFTILVWRPQVKTFPWSVLALAFTVSLVGLLGLCGSYQLAFPAPLLLLIYLLVIGPAIGLAFLALMAYTPQHAQTRLRLATLLGVALLVGFLAYLSRGTLTSTGGVHSYDGRALNPLELDDSIVGNGLNCRFSEGDRGGLLIGCGSGMLIERSEDEVQRYALSEVWGLGGQRGEEQLGEAMQFAADLHGRTWVAMKGFLGRFQSGQGVYSVGRQRGEDEESQDSDVSAGIARVWNTATGQQVAMLGGQGNSTFLAEFSPNGKRVLTLNENSSFIRVWDATTGGELSDLSGYLSSVNDAAFSPDGRRIVTASSDGTARVWDAATGQELAVLSGYESWVSSVTFSPDGQYVLTTGWKITSQDGQFGFTTRRDYTGRVWDTVKWGEVAVLGGHRGHVNSAEFSSDGRWIVTASDDRTARVWEASTGRELVALDGHEESVNSAEFSSDGQRVITSGDDGVARVWEVASGEMVAVLRGDQTDVTSAVFGPSGRLVATACGDGTAQLWDTSTWKVVTTLRMYEEVEQADIEGQGEDETDPEVGSWEEESIENWSVIFSPDGRLIAVYGAGDTAKMWQVATGQEVATFRQPHGGINWVSFSQDGTRIVTGEGVSDYVLLEPERPVTDMTLDANGNLWFTMEGGGVVRLEGGRPVGDARWEVFTAENSSLRSGDVSSLYADHEGNVWVGTQGGLSRFDGSAWEAVALPGLAADTPVTAFIEDSEGLLYAGTADGGCVGDGGTWVPFENLGGWPAGLGAALLFRDDHGGLWAGTGQGAFRLDDQGWTQLVPGKRVTAFAAGLDDVVWIGTQEGVVGYDLGTGRDTFFDSGNSGLVTDWVRDLLVDSQGVVWVSSFEVEKTQHSPLWSVGLGILFFGALFTRMYRGYQRAPETRAHHIHAQLAKQPHALYVIVHAAFEKGPEPCPVLDSLAQELERSGRLQDASIVSHLAALPAAERLDITLPAAVEVLAGGRALDEGEAVYQLYRLFQAACEVSDVSRIAQLELAVRPGLTPGEIVVDSRVGRISALPAFLGPEVVEPLRILEQTADALRNYQRVPSAFDKGTYLTQAVMKIGSAIPGAESIGVPEGVVLAAIVGRWQELITAEVSRMRGSAVLRVTLLNQQALMGDRVTLAFRLENAGQAPAENVRAVLAPSPNFALAEGDVRRLEYLSSKQSRIIEFTIIPREPGRAQITLDISWDDLEAKGKTSQLVDAILFCAAEEEFQPVPNPYVVGPPINPIADAPFVGRQDVFEWLQANLYGLTQKNVIVLYGQRRTGKTSILLQLARGPFGEKIRHSPSRPAYPVFVDLQRLTDAGTDLFLLSIAESMAQGLQGRGLGCSPPPRSAFEGAPYRAFNQFLDQVEARVNDGLLVLMLDEFEELDQRVVDGKVDRDVFSQLRYQMQHRRRIAFVLSGSHRLEEMSAEYQSIVFNVALHKEVTFLEREETEQLIRWPTEPSVHYDELAVDKIWRATHGHPYFVQLLCHAIISDLNAHARSNYVATTEVGRAIEQVVQQGDMHLKYLWDNSAPAERLVLAAFAEVTGLEKEYTTRPELSHRLSEVGISESTLVATLEHMARRRLIQQTAWRPPGLNEGAYVFSFDLLRLWLYHKHPLDTVVPQFKEMGS